MRILCYGDSNTFGYDPCGFPGGRYPLTVRWTGILSKHGHEVLNYGFNGHTIPHRTEEIQAAADLIASAQPLDAVTIMLGDNDLLTGQAQTAEIAAEHMELFLRNLLSYRGVRGPLFVLISPPRMMPGTWVLESHLLTESARLSAQFELVAERLGIAFLDGDLWNVPTVFDGVHFSAEGHTAFAEGLCRYLDGLKK